MNRTYTPTNYNDLSLKIGNKYIKNLYPVPDSQHINIVSSTKSKTNYMQSHIIVVSTYKAQRDGELTLHPKKFMSVSVFIHTHTHWHTTHIYADK